MFGTPVSLLVGLILILGSVGLFFTDRIKPSYARDIDKVYAVFILVAGIMATTFQDIGIGESFHILLMAGMLTTLMIENIRTREPKLPSQTPFDNRPPRPRYNEAPPVRRGYRAELDKQIDNRPPAGFRGDPARAPRMAPAQADYWSNAPRQPYEEYRGPAGRLQPSPEARGPIAGPIAGPIETPFDDRYAEGSGRYGERPPARPPIGRPTESANGRDGTNIHAQRPAQYPSEQYPSEQYPSEQYSSGQQDRPRDSQQASGAWESDSRQRTDWTSNTPQQSDGSRPANRPNNGERPNGERTLNVRPLSEAPRVDLPAENA